MPYLTSIRRGKVPTERELAALTARYDAIGQWDNVTLQTMGNEQKNKLETILGIDSVYLAYLHMPNSMEQAVESIAAAGYTSILSIVTSPFTLWLVQELMSGNYNLFCKRIHIYLVKASILVGSAAVF